MARRSWIVLRTKRQLKRQQRRRNSAADVWPRRHGVRPRAYSYVGEHGIRPAEGGVACSRAVRAGDVALMDNARLLRNATKPVAAVADDDCSGRDGGAQALGFAALKPLDHRPAGI